MQYARPVSASLEEQQNFSLLDDDKLIMGFLRELGVYLAKADGTQVTSESDKTQRWSRNEKTLANLSSLFKKILPVQLSYAAAAELVFS